MPRSTNPHANADTPPSGRLTAPKTAKSWLVAAELRRVSWLLFGARQHPSFLDSDPIRLTAVAPLFTLWWVVMDRLFFSFTAPRNRTLCGAKLPLISPSGSPLLPRICEDMDCLQSRLEG